MGQLTDFTTEFSSSFHTQGRRRVLGFGDSMWAWGQERPALDRGPTQATRCQDSSGLSTSQAIPVT